MKSLFSLILLTIFSLSAFADSQFLDSASLDSCGWGGTIELRKANNGDLAIQLKGLDTSRCSNLKFSDASSGRTIKAYQIKGTSYTLSKQQAGALSSDCRLNIELSGNKGREGYVILMPWWCSSSNNNSGRSSKNSDRYSFQLSGNNNCKLMIDGKYSNKNVADIYCQGAQSKNDVISYEFSKNDNCKLMVNGKYSNKNVSDSFCTKQF